jgi:hypothetical protein
MGKSSYHIIHNIFIKTLLLFSIILFFSCGTSSNLPPANNNVNVRDSIAIHQIDSVVYTPVEVIKDIVPVYDTLKMETSLSKAEAWVDTTTHTIKGKLENKKGITEKIKYVDRVEYRDSIQIKEIPYAVEVEVVKTKHPFYEWVLWILSGLFVVPLIIKLVKRFYGLK